MIFGKIHGQPEGAHNHRGGFGAGEGVFEAVGSEVGLGGQDAGVDPTTGEALHGLGTCDTLAVVEQCLQHGATGGGPKVGHGSAVEHTILSCCPPAGELLVRAAVVDLKPGHPSQPVEQSTIAGTTALKCGGAALERRTGLLLFAMGAHGPLVGGGDGSPSPHTTTLDAAVVRNLSAPCLA